MAFDIGQLREFVERAKKIKELEAEAKKLKRQNDAIEELLIEGMVESGVTDLGVGDRKVFIRSQLWASAPDARDPVTGAVCGKDWARALHAIESAGYGSMKETRVNSQRLSALVRELDKSDDGIPEELASNLKISEVTKLIVRK